jgi:hypothetical protein
MTPHLITRKDFIKSSSILLAGSSLVSCSSMLAGGQSAAAAKPNAATSGKTLKNVRLETG